MTPPPLTASEWAQGIEAIVMVLFVGFTFGFMFGERSGENLGRQLGKLDADRERTLLAVEARQARFAEMQAELEALAKVQAEKRKRGAN